jgi:hypothetical protein
MHGLSAQTARMQHRWTSRTTRDLSVQPAAATLHVRAHCA